MPQSPLALAAAFSALLAGSVGLAAGPSVQAPPNLAPYMATPQEVVDRMLQMATVTKADVVYDLGSGDGRLVITAAKRFGAHGVGVDIDPALITQSRANARKEGVEGLVEFRQQDALTVDLSPASVVTLYLLSGANLKLRPTLQKQLKPGSRIVSHQFGMGDWVPTRTETITDQRGTSRLLYLWIIGPP
ncbi:MAG: methyltransferase domain-containing protein [Vicinamibacteraceae bacterium]